MSPCLPNGVWFSAPSKQIKIITSLFIDLVKIVISLIQETPLCMSLSSTPSMLYGFPVAILKQIRIKKQVYNYTILLFLGSLDSF